MDYLKKYPEGLQISSANLWVLDWATLSCLFLFSSKWLNGYNKTFITAKTLPYISLFLFVLLCDDNEFLHKCPLCTRHLRASEGEAKGRLQIKGNISTNNRWKQLEYALRSICRTFNLISGFSCGWSPYLLGVSTTSPSSSYSMWKTLEKEFCKKNKSMFIFWDITDWGMWAGLSGSAMCLANIIRNMNTYSIGSV